jgi:hypothetical protein
MRKKIQNNLKITCDDVDFTAVTDLEFYVKQLGFEGCYTPIVITAHEMVVRIPFSDALNLREGDVKLQFAFVDENGVPRASDVVETTVKTLLKEVGYDPV